MPKAILLLIFRTASFFCYTIIVVFVFGSVAPTLAGSLEELKQAFQTDDVEAVWQAVDKMPKNIPAKQKEEAIRLLTQALHKEWSRCTGDIRQAIANQLADLGAKEAIPDLLELVRKNKNIEHECAECGCCFLSQSVSDIFLELEPDFFCENRVLDALQSLATFSYAKEISELVESTTPYRPQLIVILGKIGHPRYAYFIAKFADAEPLAVAQALGTIKEMSAIPVLGRLLENPNESVRTVASKSLTLIGGERVTNTVRLRLHHPNQDISALAAKTLSLLGADDGLSVLRNLAREAKAQRTRCMAIAYLGQLKDFGFRPVCIDGLKDKSPLVRAYSIYALGYIGVVEDIPRIEASLLEAKTIDPEVPEDEEGLMLIDETTREALRQIRTRSGNNIVGF